MYPKKQVAQLVLSACYQFKIDTVVICPGSRNAPLIIGFSNHPNIKTLSVVDERCACFFALGIAQQIQKPVAIICSSGSAVLNYYPAITEAFYSNIPLVIISADRPKYLIDIGDGQTIRQEYVFKNHILFSANLTENHTDATKNHQLLNTALQTCIYKKGPVHINVPFSEPLYETTNQLTNFNIRSSFLHQKRDHYTIEKFSKLWNLYSKKIILIGVHIPNLKLQKIIDKLSQDPSVLVFTETTSNLYNEKGINSIDKLIFTLKDEQLKELRPHILITCGGMVISKKIKQFLRRYNPSHHWHVSELKSMDTYHCLSEFIEEKPEEFLSKLYAKTDKITSDYQSKWLKEKEKRNKKHQQYIANAVFSDLKVFEQVLKGIPNHYMLQSSNSSTIRYLQLFDLHKSLRVFCNRGTSGIEGSTSTAIGAAYATKNKTVFLTGDLSFFYDSNALWNKYIPKSFRIVLINNSGGGIFRCISGPTSTNAIDYFETPHNLTAEHLCKMYHFQYDSVVDLKSLEELFNDFYKTSNQPKLIEIFTPKQINDVILKNYFEFLS